MTTTPATGTFRVLSRVALALGVLSLAGCVALAAYSATDTSSSTSSVGVVIALVLAIPVVVALVLVLAGMAARRASGGAGLALVVCGLLVLVVLDGLIGLQLLFGE